MPSHPQESLSTGGKQAPVAACLERHLGDFDVVLHLHAGASVLRVGGLGAKVYENTRTRLQTALKVGLNPMAELLAASPSCGCRRSPRAAPCPWRMRRTPSPWFSPAVRRAVGAAGDWWCLILWACWRASKSSGGGSSARWRSCPAPAFLPE